MAQVPTYQPQVNPTDLPGVRQQSIASPGLFDAGSRQNEALGGAIEGAGSKMADIAIDMQHRQNADMLFRAETAAKTNYIAFQTQALNKRGADAEGITTQAGDFWKKQLADNSENLQNDVQKYLFKEQIAKLRTQSMEQMSMHEAQQKRVSLNESASASIQASTNLAASQVGTPMQDQAIAAAKDDIPRRLEVQRQLQGWGPVDGAKYQTELDKALTNLHLQVIQNLNRADPDQADAYFKLNKGEINGGMYESIDKLIANGNYLIGAQRAVDTVMAMRGADGKPLSEADAADAIRETTKGRTQRAAMTELRQQFRDQREAVREDSRDADNQGLKTWVATENQSAIPPDVWGRMSGVTQLEIKRLAEKKAKGEPVETDWSVYSALRKLYSNPNTEEAFRDVNLTNYASRLAGPQMKDLIDLQTNPKPAGEESLGWQLHTAFEIAGWSEASNRQQMGQFEYTARQAIKDAEQTAGKRLDDDARQKIIDRLMLDGKINGSSWFRDTRGKGYEFYNQPEATNFAPLVVPPPTDKVYQKARQSIIDNTDQKNPTDAQIMETIRQGYANQKRKQQSNGPAPGAGQGYGVLVPSFGPVLPAPTSRLPPEEPVPQNDKVLRQDSDVEAERNAAFESYQAAEARYGKAVHAYQSANDAGAEIETLNDLHADIAKAKVLADHEYQVYKKKLHRP